MSYYFHTVLHVEARNGRQIHKFKLQFGWCGFYHVIDPFSNISLVDLWSWVFFLFVKKWFIVDIHLRVFCDYLVINIFPPFFFSWSDKLGMAGVLVFGRHNFLALRLQDLRTLELIRLLQVSDNSIPTQQVFDLAWGICLAAESKFCSVIKFC